MGHHTDMNGKPRAELREVVHDFPMGTQSQYEVIGGGFTITAETDLHEPAEVDFGFLSNMNENPTVVVYSMKTGLTKTTRSYSFNAWYRDRAPNESITMRCRLFYDDGK